MAEKTRRHRPRPTLSEADLEEAARHYLDRFWVPADQLRRVLQRRVDKALREQPIDPDVARAWREAVVERFVEGGVVDDGRWAIERARVLLERGRSPRAIRADLQGRRLASEHIDAAVASLRDEATNPELKAAATLARRRRLGPYRVEEERRERRERDLGAMARAGFSFDLARRIIDAPDGETVESWLDD